MLVQFETTECCSQLRRRRQNPKDHVQWLQGGIDQLRHHQDLKDHVQEHQKNKKKTKTVGFVPFFLFVYFLYIFYIKNIQIKKY